MIPGQIQLLLSVLLLPLVLTETPDWLVTKIKTKTFFEGPVNGTAKLANGLVSRDFIVEPDFATVDYYSYEKDSSLFRAVSPEAVIALDGKTYNIGGVLSSIPRAYMNRTALRLNMTQDPDAFHYDNLTILKPQAPFSYTPMRGAPQDIQWPPIGIRVDIKFKAPKGAPEYHQMVSVTVHYEMYDGIPLLTKWVSVDAPPEVADKVKVAVKSVEYLAVNRQWAPTNYNAHHGAKVEECNWLYIETDQAHGTSVRWGVDSHQKKMPGSYEPIVNCIYVPIPEMPISDGFESFRVHELLVGSSDPERSSLARHRMFRLLAPHTQENPIFFHMTKSSSKEIRAVIDQMAEVGFEMLIYSYHSGFNIESANEKYIKQVAKDIAYAKARGIEVGGYDLIAWTRKSKPQWMAIDPHRHKSSGSSCFASEWYDYLLDKFITFMNKTGLSMVETDGPYQGYPCESKEHKYHKDVGDSIYQQQKLQGKFYTILREMQVYINQPDHYFYQGGSKNKFDYNEKEFDLPRWQDISIGRQLVYDDTYRLIPTAGWMFVPLIGNGGHAGVFEPLAEHRLEYEWALAQYLGAGVAACYRGYRLYHTNETKAIVSKWVSFYKKYRDILTSDIVHVRRPDMQTIDSFMHVNPFIKNRGLAMVFNPTDKMISKDLVLPLYYTGLNDVALISHEGSAFQKYQIDRNYKVPVKVNMPPLTITWYLIQDGSSVGKLQVAKHTEL